MNKRLSRFNLLELGYLCGVDTLLSEAMHSKNRRKRKKGMCHCQLLEVTSMQTVLKVTIIALVHIPI
jgi:hypothetical protein